MIYDQNKTPLKSLPNSNTESIEELDWFCAIVASRGLPTVVSGEFGAKVKSIIDSLQIQLVD